jgi:hypothetical protein
MQAVPVVLNLSTWQDKHALEDWVEVELKNKYFVSRRLSRAWLESNRLILLLDGLDEAPANSRASCVSAINEFVQHRGLPGIVVCSRRTEYSALPHRLSFRGAVCLQPLTNEQIVDYLNKFESQLVALRQAIQQDEIPAELTQTPLMLSIMSLAFQGADGNELARQKGNSLEERRKQIFRLYVEQMFRRKGTTPLSFPKKKIIGWLSWLAGKMREHSQSVFLVEGVQPSWLGTRAERVAYRTAEGLSLGLFCGLIVGLIFGPLLGLRMGLFVGLFTLLVTCLIFVLYPIFDRAEPDHVVVVETISWNWNRFWRRTADLGLFSGLILVVIGVIAGVNTGNLGEGLKMGLFLGLICRAGRWFD